MTLSLADALQAGQRWIVWHSDDERACKEELDALSTKLRRKLRLWSIEGTEHPYIEFEQTLDRVLHAPLANDDERELWVWFDYHPPTANTPRLIRKLRSLAQQDHGVSVVFVQYYPASEPRPPERIHIERPEPSVSALLDYIGRKCVDPDLNLGASACDRLFEFRSELARHCAGLEFWQVDQALRWVAAYPTLSAGLSALERFKASALNADHLLERCDSVPSDALGGLEGYKAWLRRQRHAMTPLAADKGIPRPRGALLVGVPGCGKSLAARVTASALGMPLYRLDLGRLFTGVLGGSEARMRQTLSLCERLAPAVVWIDEVEKGLASGSAVSDGGTSQRNLATLMTWLQEHQSEIFLVATANRIEALPPEFTRKGRLDETFFVDLPDAQEREAILRVYGVDAWPCDPSPANTIAQTQGYSGSELRAAVSQARLNALIEGRPPSWEDLSAALSQSPPLATTREQDIGALRAWGKLHARSAKGQ